MSDLLIDAPVSRRGLMALLSGAVVATLRPGINERMPVRVSPGDLASTARRPAILAVLDRLDAQADPATARKAARMIADFFAVPVRVFDGGDLAEPAFSASYLRWPLLSAASDRGLQAVLEVRTHGPAGKSHHMRGLTQLLSRAEAHRLDASDIAASLAGFPVGHPGQSPMCRWERAADVSSSEVSSGGVVPASERAAAAGGQAPAAASVPSSTTCARAA